MRNRGGYFSGPSIMGDQESGWLYRQTKELQALGVEITYSGDSPFLTRLVLGISTERSSSHPSQLAIYVCEEKFLPTCCSDVDGRRTSLKIPFRQHVPREALASIFDVRTVSPYATHMITRCTENDIRRVDQKVINDKHPWEALSIQRFEKHLFFSVLFSSISPTRTRVKPQEQ